MKPLTLKLLILGGTLLLTGARANAQVYDMWTGLEKATYKPHLNTCDASEVFVTVGGGSTGYCIEADKRTAAIWTEAKQTCASAGKRLPEFAEYQYACNHPPTGLVNMTGDDEWIGNNPLPLVYTSSYYGVAAAAMGYGGCSEATIAWAGRNDSSTNSLSFRCVR